MTDDHLYTSTYFTALVYNFLVALNFTNNAIYPLYVTQSGGTAAQVGVFMSAYSIAAVLGRPLVGTLIDRYGVKPVLVLGSLLLSLPPLGYLLLMDAGLSPLVWCLRIFQGFGFGAHFTAFFTLAAQIAPRERRNEAVAMYGISGLGANLVGPLLGEKLTFQYGLPVFFITMALLGFLAVFCATRFRIQPLPETTVPKLRGLAAALRSRALAFPLVLAAALAVSYTTPIVFIAQLARLRTISGFGLYFTAYALGGIGIRLAGRRWADRVGWRRILVPAFLLYGGGLVTIYFSTVLAGFVAAGLLTGTAHGLAFPAVTSLGYTLAPERAKGSAMALVTGMMDFGSFLTGICLGMLAEKAGYAVVFLAGAAVPAASAGLILVNLLRNPRHLARRAAD